jgi:hypothetical protein
VQPWDDRAVEEANLFNPAFGAMLLAKAADDFFKRTGRPLPFALAFLVLPIVLHQGTRSALPGTTVTSLLSWVPENRAHLVDFGLRVRRLRTITQEAIMFAVGHATLALDERGDLLVGPQRLTVTEKRTPMFTSEARDCLDRAGFIGRWFAAAGTPSTIYSAWGVTP